VPDDDGRGGLGGLLELITRILRSCADAEDEHLDATIDAALAAIGGYTDVDRSYVFLYEPDGVTFRNTHEWCAEGIDPQIDELQAVPQEAIVWWIPRLAAGEPVHVPDVGALGADRREERELLEPQGIRSLVAVPLLTGGRLMGFVGFDAVRQHRTWSTEAMLLLRSVADVIIGGIVRRDARRAVVRNEERFRALVRHSSDVVLILGGDGEITYLGASAARVLGWDAQTSLGTRYLDAVHVEDLPSVRAALAAAGAGEGAEVTVPDHRLQHSDGSWRWFLATVADLSGHPAIGGVVLNAHDITSRKRAEEALQHQALHDPLTGLPNRLLLQDRLEHALGRIRRTGSGTVGVVFVDLDRFKDVNDTLGHSSGDQLLAETARRLTARVRPSDTVARFGGDEFVVLLDGVDADSALPAAERLLGAFDVPFRIGQRDHHVTASAGVVVTDSECDVEALLRDADAAMYQAKSRGRARIERFDAPLRERLLRTLTLAEELRTALASGGLHLAYQPVFDLAAGAIVGTEALLRWTHPVHGRISPADVIPIAEEHGLIVPLGSWVLDEALRQLRAWQDERPEHPPMFVAVNVSVHQLIEGDLVGTVRTLLARYGLRPEQLCLELTESALMAEPDASSAALGELRDLGVGLAIDDFGTGYSSLAYLRNLPVTTLKVDRSFVTGLGRDARDSRVIAAIIGLAHEFGMRTVAEGVETVRQLTELRALGCTAAQGYYLLRPLPPEEISDLQRAIRPGAPLIRGSAALAVATR
jgi:diguanylate cyclase (GGDEF)-like protein/PAS domain S-box-containing protein